MSNLSEGSYHESYIYDFSFLIYTKILLVDFINIFEVNKLKFTSIN